MGGVLGGLMGAAALIAYRDLRLAGAVAVALLVAGTVAATVGLALPWALARAGKDPAYGSGPIATIVQDVLSILAYFAAVSLLG